MTYKQWITATTARFNVSAADVDLILVNQAALIPDPDATVDVITAKRALVAEFASVIPMANVSEGGFSISWNMDAVKLWHKSICQELGIKSVTTAKVQNKSDLW